MTTQLRNDELLGNFSADYQKRYESTFSWRTAHGMFQSLPGLRGFWGMSTVSTAGSIIDNGAGGLNMLRNGNPQYTYVQNGLIPTIELDGSGDFFSIADTGAIDITGAESFVNSSENGLTMGGWFYVTSYNVGSPTPFMGKWSASGQKSYALETVSGSHVFRITNDGSTNVTVTSLEALLTGEWFFIVGRFTPSTELAIWVDNEKDTNTTAIPASIYSGSSDFEIGRENVTTSKYLTGYPAFCFLCATKLPDMIINQLWHHTKVMFGK